MVGRVVAGGLALSVLLAPVAGCGGTSGRDAEFSKIEMPTAVAQYQVTELQHPDNLVRWELGGVRDSGQITPMATTNAQPPAAVEGQFEQPTDVDPGDLPGATLLGAAFSIELDDQWGYPMVLGDYWFLEQAQHMAVLELTFPPPVDEPALVSWFVTPHLICRYEVGEPLEGSPEETLGIAFHYVILPDPIGAHGLLETPPEVMLTFLDAGVEGQAYLFVDGESGNLVAAGDEHSGTWTALPGAESKLFVGVLVILGATNQGDWLQVGGDGLASSVSDPERCTLSIGSDSYYTMRTATPPAAG